MASAYVGPRDRYRHLSKAYAGSELHRLCRNGDLSAIRSYLNETLTEAVVNKAGGTNGCTPLHEAAMAGRGDVIRLLTEESDSLNLNVRTQRGPASTALHLAAERGHVECVMALIECGAHLEVLDRRCRTAKDVAAENGQKQVVYTISVAEVEKAVSEGNVVKLNEVCTALEASTLFERESEREREREMATNSHHHAHSVLIVVNYQILYVLYSVYHVIPCSATRLSLFPTASLCFCLLCSRKFTVYLTI